MKKSFYKNFPLFNFLFTGHVHLSFYGLFFQNKKYFESGEITVLFVLMLFICVTLHQPGHASRTRHFYVKTKEKN
jgi:hypothetical protein